MTGSGPRVLGSRFTLQAEPISVGGHAQLFKGFDADTAETVAVKVFTPPVPVDPKVLRLSWSTEVDAYRRLGEHPNLLQVREFDPGHSGEAWIVFDWGGEDLEKVATRTRLSWTDLRPIAMEILSGLSELHAKGYVHRDVKPRNILVDGSHVRLADFGTLRVREFSTPGMTMGPMGTQPYSPPEAGTDSPVPAYDVYSFAVLIISCLAQDFEMTSGEVEAALTTVPIPDGVRALLARCLETDPLARPGSAAIVRAELESILRGTVGTGPSREIGLDLTPIVNHLLRQLLQIEALDLNDVRQEFGAVSRFLPDPKKDPGTLMLIGRSLIGFVSVHHTRMGHLVLKHVWKPPLSQLERARRRATRASVNWVFAALSPNVAAEAISAIFQKVGEAAAEELERAPRSDVQDRWARVLSAKFALARESGRDLSYSSYRVDGSRVYLTLDGSSDPALGELRMIKTTRGRALRGEIESVEGNEIVLYVSEGQPNDIPSRGTVSMDAERTVSKLRREEDAVDRVFGGTAARSDLRDILDKPSSNPRSEPIAIAIEQFVQGHLDSPKREAVRAALGAKGISLVKGPPGTGKTTLIAELVAQQLRRDPSSRILLAAQTHIALDHALSTVTKVTPGASVLRIGSVERMATRAEQWTVPSQLAAWKEETASKLAKFIDDTSSAGDSSTGWRTTVARYTATVERRNRASAALVDRSAALVAATAARDSVLSALDRLIGAVGSIAADGDVGPELAARINALADASTEVGLKLEGDAEVIKRVRSLDQEVLELQERTSGLEREADALLDGLRDVDVFAELSDEAAVQAKISELATAEDARIQELQVLAEDWIERFRPTAQFRLALLFRASVVGSTCVALTGFKGAERVKFDLCIIDEASKATPTELMVPMASARQWVLVGDERQLPPFLDSGLTDPDFLEDRRVLRSEVDERLFASLAASLPGSSVHTLTQQYRMHPTIGNLISEVFYDGALSSNPRALDPIMKQQFGSAVAWLHVAAKGAQQRVGLSYANRAEAKMIAENIQAINGYAEILGLEAPVEIAVLSGYSAQVRVLQEVVSNANSRAQRVRVRFATIDSFQGQEADLCFVSMTRSNPEGDIGFLASRERLNVALSRARNGLVIVGDRSMLKRAKRGKAAKLIAVEQYVRAANG